MIRHRISIFKYCRKCSVKMIQILAKNFSVNIFDKFCKVVQYNTDKALNFVPHCLLRDRLFH